MPLIYDILLFFGILVSLPYLFYRKNWHRGFFQRLGGFPPGIRQRLAAKKNIWIHAVSVGEVLAVGGFIEQIKTQLPGYQIVCSTVTTTGQKLAQERLGPEHIVLYAPLDFRGVVQTFLRVIKPQIYLCAETEIWPNLFKALHRAKVPAIIVNGRISDQSYKGYRKLRFFLKDLIEGVDHFCMQTDLDQQRIVALGALEECVSIVGNMKFDIPPEGQMISREQLGFDHANAILIAGSTHPGEEEIMLAVYQKLISTFPSLRLILAPRHIERTSDVVNLVKARGLNPIKLSERKEAGIESRDVVVVDTIGQLRSLYGIANIVFIGKTLKVGGGQNIIEPAFFGKPIIVGPRTQNFKDVIQQFRAAKAILQIADGDQLLEAIKRLLKDPQEQQRIGQAALHLVRHSQGATQKTLAIVKRALNTP